MSTNADTRSIDFERRFDLYFPRVYAYAFRSTQDHAAAERVTRDVLVRSLPELVDADEPELAALLLQATRRCLQSESGTTASGGQVPHGSESFPPASAARPSTSVTRASRLPRSSQARRASGARRR